MSNGTGRKTVVVAVDTGGTFTDVVCLAGGAPIVVKIPSTPHDPADAVLRGVRAAREAAGALDQPYVLVHGSTVATNAVLERRGARVALITNRGFEDVIEIARQDRPQLYALVGTRPPAIVPREMRHGIGGRLGPRGEELAPLDDDELAALTERLLDAQSVAVCLLHSYANPEHEQRVGAALQGTGLPISLSSELLPEFREYERTATTVVNAYVAPVVSKYLARIESEAAATRVRVMGSAGGALPVARARRESVHTILSGPAGGVMGALDAARRAGIENVLTFDMGGTSTDVALCPGEPRWTREFRIGDLPVAVPVLDIHTVGAGGGSIARVDSAGALRVGPESAGAEPGPVCYGRGGTEITVTDANVWLGRLPAVGWRHGSGRGPGLDRSVVEAPMRALAQRMDASPEAAAEGVIAVVNTAMEGALRVISVERGHDPADFALLAFGGAAGLHALELAERLAIPRVLFPPAPGVLSAFGMLVAPIRKDVARTILAPVAPGGSVDLEQAFADLERLALAAMAEEGMSPDQVQLARRVDARYHGQSFELTVDASDWVETFHGAHRQRYGYERRDAVVEAVTLRVQASTAATDPERARLPDATGPAEPVQVTRAVHRAESIESPVYDRAALRAGHKIVGPAVIVEYTATAWIRPGWTVTVLPDGSLAGEHGS